MEANWITTILVCICLNSVAQPGSLDVSFDDDGKTITSIEISDIAISTDFQPDGKLIVAGVSSSSTPQNNVISIVRYLPNGALDENFGMGGILTSPIGFTGYVGERLLALQPDGKLVIGGYSHINNGTDFAVARFMADGTIDTSFGHNGIANTNFDSPKDDVFAVLIQPDSKIVAVGTKVGSNAYFDIALARYLPNGTPDLDFGANGKITTALGSYNDYPYSAILQANGKMVLSGITSDGNVLNTFLLRYQTDGVIDSTFGTNGIVYSEPNSGLFGAFSSLRLQTDNKLLQSAIDLTSGSTLVITRYNSDGSPDPTFGSNGVVRWQPNNYSGEGALAVQPDGKILVAASLYQSGKYHFLLSRFHADGTLDNSFGTGGSTITNVSNSSQARGIALSQTGRIAVVGADFGQNGIDFAIAMYYSGLVKTTEFELIKQMEAYPNPVSFTFELKYALSKASFVRIYLLDSQGRFVESLMEQAIRTPGMQTEFLSTKQCPSGVYHLIVQAAQETHHLTLLIENDK